MGKDYAECMAQLVNISGIYLINPDLLSSLQLANMTPVWRATKLTFSDETDQSTAAREEPASSSWVLDYYFRG